MLLLDVRDGAPSGALTGELRGNAEGADTERGRAGRSGCGVVGGTVGVWWKVLRSLASRMKNRASLTRLWRLQHPAVPFCFGEFAPGCIQPDEALYRIAGVALRHTRLPHDR
jgi:hypothetical protein